MCAGTSHARAFAPFPSPSSRVDSVGSVESTREDRMRIGANAERPEVHAFQDQVKFARRAPPPGRHFWSGRTRGCGMGLWSGVRAHFDTLSITVYRSLNAVTCGKSRLLPPAASRVRALFANLSTPVPLEPGRSAFAPIRMRSSRAHAHESCSRVVSMRP